jgi:hypothetical protein
MILIYGLFEIKTFKLIKQIYFKKKRESENVQSESSLEQDEEEEEEIENEEDNYEDFVFII